MKIGNLKQLFGDNDRIVLKNSVEECVVFVKDKQVYAIETICPHSGGPLHLAEIEDAVAVCPWHEYRFSLMDGECTEHGLTAKTFMCSVDESGDLWLEGIGWNTVAITDKSIPNSCYTQPTVKPNNNNLSEWIVTALNTADALEKVQLTQYISKVWNSRELTEIGKCIPPHTPPRNQLEIEPWKLKSNKSGSLVGRIKILHSLANIELWAIDLALDILVRYNGMYNNIQFPIEFYSDFIQIALEESKHFSLLTNRIQSLGSYFGAYPVHHGLWQSAIETSDSLVARIAIVHMVHEARGLDVNPNTIQKFVDQNDVETVELLNIIHSDEIGHVAIGQKWFSFIAEKLSVDKYELFHGVVRQHFRGELKPPFNRADRLEAGIDEKYYLPVSSLQQTN